MHASCLQVTAVRCALTATTATRRWAYRADGASVTTTSTPTPSTTATREWRVQQQQSYTVLATPATIVVSGTTAAIVVDLH